MSYGCFEEPCIIHGEKGLRTVVEGKPEVQLVSITSESGTGGKEMVKLVEVGVVAKVTVLFVRAGV